MEMTEISCSSLEKHWSALSIVHLFSIGRPFPLFIILKEKVWCKTLGEFTILHCVQFSTIRSEVWWYLRSDLLSVQYLRPHAFRIPLEKSSTFEFHLFHDPQRNSSLRILVRFRMFLVSTLNQTLKSNVSWMT